MGSKFYFIITWIILSVPVNAFAQDTLTYFNERWEEVMTKDSASFYRIGKNDFGFYDSTVRDYYITGELQMEGYFRDQIQNGTFTWYFKNGKKMAIAQYVYGNFILQQGWDTSGLQVVKDGNGSMIWYNPYDMNTRTPEIYKEGKAINNDKYEYDGMIAKNIGTNKKPDISIWDKDGKQLVINGTGTIISYYKNGNIKYRQELKDNKPVGKLIQYYSNGKIQYEVSWTDFLEEGPMRYYYNNGQLRKEVNYHKGKQNGPVTWWYSNGVVECTGFYFKNKRKSDWIWYDKKGEKIDYVHF
jgi:antitoxin component YwqK of YwqJK toxin-antitoxin module